MLLLLLSDVNECNLTSPICSASEDCHNTMGNHMCTCKPGYERLSTDADCTGIICYTFINYTTDIIVYVLHTCQVSRFKASNHALMLTPIILMLAQKSMNWEISVSIAKLTKQNWFAKYGNSNGVRTFNCK